MKILSALLYFGSALFFGAVLFFGIVIYVVTQDYGYRLDSCADDLVERGYTRLAADRYCIQNVKP